MIIHNPILTGSLSLNGVNLTTSNLVTTGSNNFTGSQAISGSLDVTGNITAQTLVVQTVTSSVIYSSGSNVFGNSLANTQVFTGSMLVTGSLNIIGGNQIIRSNTNQVLLLSSSFSTGLYTSYQSGSTVIGDIGNGSQVFSAGDVTAFGINARDTRKLQLGAAQTVVMTISGNNVGIGNTSPSFPLEVSNTSSGLIARFTSNQNEAQIRLVNTSTGGRTYSIGSGGTSSGGARGFYIYDETSGFTAFTITGSGNVGIGTNTPNDKFVVDGGNNIWTGVFRGTSTSSQSFGVQIFAGSNSSDTAFRILNGATTANLFFVRGDGNVGIGTSSPADKLEIYNGTYHKIRTFFDGSYTSGFKFSDYNGGIKYDAATDRLTLFTNYAGDAEITFDTVSTERMRIANTGDVLINTTSTASAYAWLHVRGASKGIAIQSSVDNNYRAIYSTSNILYFWNGSNEGGLNASGVWFNASDVTIKKDIEDIKYGLNEVLQLKPRSYKMIEDNSDQIGFIAQEIEEILPELVSTSERGMKGLSYGQITAVLAKAIKELKAEIDELKNK